MLVGLACSQTTENPTNELLPTEPTATLGQACSTHADCADTEYCQDGDPYACDEDRSWAQRTCAEKPTACDDVAAPVCACDGEVYGNECEAAAAGVNVGSYVSSCAPPPGMFACRNRFCDAGSEYCTSEFEGSVACQPLPDVGECSSTPSCESCFGETLPGDCYDCFDSGGVMLECGVF